MTIAFDSATPARLKEVSEKFDISYARLIACLLALRDEQIKQVISDHYNDLFPSAAQRHKKEREILDITKGYTPEQLAEILNKKEQS